MTNFNFRYIPLLLTFIFLQCKKEASALSNESQQHTNNEKNREIKKVPVKVDSIIVEVSTNYILEASKNKVKIIQSDFFQPIKKKLIEEKIYYQILYDNENIIINLEFGDNANYYEDFYLSKQEPIMIEKISRTTIDKTSDTPTIIVCEEQVGRPLSVMRYRTVDDKSKKCHTSVLK